MYNQLKENLKAIRFAAILCLVCGLLLTTMASGLKDRQAKNVLIDKQKNILASVGLIHSEKSYSSAEIEGLYTKNIKQYWVDASGQIESSKKGDSKYLGLYLYIKNQAIESYIIPIDTRGLWGPIHGYLALKKDGSTISGFTVYSHSETPGLGGEIESKWFRKNFIGKRIVDRKNEFTSIAISKGEIPDASRINMVDGISGATLTGKYLSKGLKDILLEYESVSIRFRKNLLKFSDQGQEKEPGRGPGRG